MAKKVVGGIYYFKAWQEDTRRDQFKIYIYLCDIDGCPVFVKVNRKCYSFTTQTTIYKKDYPNNNVIQEEKSYLDCGRLIRGFSLSEFETISEKSYEGDLCLFDLINLNDAIKTVTTLSPKEQRIIEKELDKRIFELI